MTALIIIGSILLFLFLLTVFPVRFYISFKDEFKLDIGYLFLRFPILPGKEKPEEEAPKEKTGEKKGSGRLKEILQQHGFMGFLKAMRELVKMLLNTSKRTLSHFKVKHFDLYMCVGGADDAAEAAIQYGQISAGIYSACGVIFSLIPCKNKHITVDIDYKQPENTVDFKGMVSVAPLFVIKEGLSLVIQAFPTVKKIFLSKPKTAHKIK